MTIRVPLDDRAAVPTVFKGLRACLVKVRVIPFARSGVRRERIYLIALFARSAWKTEEAALKNRLQGANVLYVGEADLAPPSLTLLLAKQALR